MLIILSFLVSPAHCAPIVVFNTIWRMKPFERTIFETQTRCWLYLCMIVVARYTIMNSVPTQKISLFATEPALIFKVLPPMDTAFLLRSHCSIKSASLTLNILGFQRLVPFLSLFILLAVRETAKVRILALNALVIQ